MKILDATCGTRSIWYQKDLPYVTFMDKRKVNLRSSHPIGKQREYRINPVVVSEWKDAPFPDNYFDIVVFDPPHLVWKNEKKECSLDKTYGHFMESDYKHVLRDGIKKLFSVLKPEGVFIFKWCESSKPLGDILPLFPYKPLFGTRTGQKNKNHWVLFIKYRMEKRLLEG